jgi:ribosomal protein S27E
MRTFWIHCPHCHKASKLFLTSKPYLMVLNCPVCDTTLVNSEGVTYEIESTEIVNIEKHQIKNFMKKLKKQLQEKNKPFSISSSSSMPSKAQKNEAHGLIENKVDSKGPDLSKDDIINLKIDLESCEDVSDFISMM